jgi:hypothetical protein
MANYGDALAALDAYRAELYEEVGNEAESGGAGLPAPFAARGAFGGQAGPLANVHATGVGLRTRGGKLVPGDYVLKVYVFDKQNLGAATPALTSQPFDGIGVDVEALPIQQAAPRAGAQLVGAAPLALVANRNRHRPIPGGVSIAPLHAPYVGTLGCFVRRSIAGVEQVFALSNNHVLADTNQLALGTSIVQPGAETGISLASDTFAQLSSFIPIGFAVPNQPRPTNFFDAAIARVTDVSLIQKGGVLGVAKYVPKLIAPLPGMAVTKSGRTTGVTTGTIIATHVNNVQINYGTSANPIIALFNDTIHIRSQQGAFSGPGDSGSAILDAHSGKGTGLLFAGDGFNTFACNLAGACRRFHVTLA